MPQISYRVRQKIRNRLAHVTTGFNNLLAQACQDQRPVPDAFVIDFADQSASFWQSQILSEQLDATSDDSGTICTLYGIRAPNQTGTYQKFAVYSGIVVMGVEFDIAWNVEDAPSDTEGLADATESAMVECFNAEAYQAELNADGVIWNGLIESGPRGPLRQSGPGWRQRIPFALTFELET